MDTAVATASPASTTSKKHPKGLWVLFSTEMWERFNFYGMRTLLTLFIVNSLMMSKETSSLIYGGFLGLCYLTPMLGGFISDRFLGNRYCIILGGTLMAIGQMFLFTSASVFGGNLEFAKTLLYIGLGVIILGNGFFKPNISSMVGSLYPAQEKNKLDTAFTIFYMGINVGAFLGQFICPVLGDVVDKAGVRDIHAFKWGFLAASLAMLTGTISFFFLKDKYVRTPEGRPIGGLPKHNTAADFAEGEAQNAHFTGKALGGAVIAFAILAFLFNKVAGQNVIYSIIYGSGISLAGLILTDKSLTKVERDRILVIYIVSFFIIFFWAAFEQAGSSLTFIADNQTDRNFLGWQMPPSMVQIFNGIFVVAFAVPFSLLWDKLRASGKEPISPFKQAIGLFLIALSYFIIAHNVKDLGNSGLLAVKWLILLYLIQTFGELCLSPIGLSLVGKLAPKRFASLLFGVFFLSNASGYALAGTLGSILPATGEQFKKANEAGINLQGILDKTVTATPEQLKFLETAKINVTNPVFAGFEIHNLFQFFMVFVVLCGVASALLFALTPVLKKMMHGVR
ncbi:peptide MFS transporter [Pinibacter aurantiacus]|uniref:Peptide MFS transporter n=1 Tax=Pinibacter aurantiacus TaxID=2851599 RepID=A0A9E2SAZ2_9BACT|nr:peptide MFS transporter [Pinibacter aurantiacus]MBV4357982.1 peptide MFS transporter [Pinibacter aurantiacus]